MKNKTKKLIFTPMLTAVICAMLSLISLGGEIGAGIVRLSWGNLNVRSSPSSSSRIVSKLSDGDYVTIHAKTGDWYSVEYADGTFGYCHANYIKPISYDTATVKTTGGNLNVRSSGSSSGYVIDKLSNGQQVVILSGSGAWYRVLYDGSDTGWVSSTYLRRTTSSEDTGKSEAYPAIYLSVPYYSQSDPRWGHIQIGSYGENLTKIGCTVTCFAMSESYRTNSTVTPARVAANQSFTPGGALYWPSNYTRTAASSYLSYLYGKLSEGVPVLFEAKKSNGAKHWVLVTGYTGGETLTASAFVINDPSPQKRATLASLLAEYPIYSKMAHYTK
jgi:uncharacterized protein YgiM (DUF1202 family)